MYIRNEIKLSELSISLLLGTVMCGVEMTRYLNDIVTRFEKVFEINTKYNKNII